MLNKYLYGKLKDDKLKQFEGDYIIADKIDFNSHHLNAFSIDEKLSAIIDEVETTLKKQDFFFISRLKRRERESQNRLYRTLYPKVKNHILKNSGNEEDAQDFTQDTIIKLYNKLYADDGKITNVIGFALGILRFDWLKELQKRKNKFEKGQKFVDETSEETYQIEEPETGELGDCKMIILKECMQQLKTDQRAFLQYYDLNNHSIKETALHFNMDEGSVRVKANRCRSYLHKKIVNHPSYEKCFA